MAKHAKLSASGSKRYLTCPGSIAYVDDLPENMKPGTNEAAQTGTCAHALGEHCLAEKLKSSEDFLGRIIWIENNPDGDAFLAVDSVKSIDELYKTLGAEEIAFACEVDERMVEAVDVYLNTIWTDLEKLGPETTEMSIERGFNLSWLRPDMFGTSDCTLYQFMGLLSVYDYKNGRVGVEATDNTQGLYYALGMAHEVEWLFEEVEIIIVQPNSPHEDGHVRRWRISKDKLKEFQEYLAAGYDKVQEAIKQLAWVDDETSWIEWSSTWLNTGEDGSHCSYCPAQTICPAVKNKASELAKADFDIDDPEELEINLTDNSADNLAKLQEILKWAPFLDRLIKAAKALAEKRLLAGKEVPGYKAVAGKANRQFDKTADEILEVFSEAGLEVDRDDLFATPKEPVLKSPAQMEKISKEAKKLVAGVWDKKANTWAIKPLAIKGEGKPTVVPENDPRKALELGPNVDFEEDADFEPIKK